MAGNTAGSARRRGNRWKIAAWAAAALIRYHNSFASRQQCLGKPFRRQVAAQSFFACTIEDEAGHGGELPA
jgi:hypothetical protein